MTIDALVEKMPPDLIRLAEKCEYECGHTWQVACLASELYDQLVDLHGLPQESEYYLLAGALIHDIGWCKGGKGHHKTAYEILVAERPKSLSPREAQIIGLIGRYHRKSLPSSHHTPYARLSATDKQVVSKLAALLRVADGLDRGHRSIVQSLACEVSKKAVDIKIPSDEPLALEIWSALRKGDLFRQVYKRELIIHRV